jgi:hypothetical protein
MIVKTENNRLILDLIGRTYYILIVTVELVNEVLMLKYNFYWSDNLMSHI